MKFRDVSIFNGERFAVPQGIQRIDLRTTHGWQVRYGGTRFFADRSLDGSGAAAALEVATQELLKRIARLPAPTRLQVEPSETKSTDLPVGITGPLTRLRKGAKVRDSSLSVSLPRFGETPRRRSVYIGNENTYTEARYHTALTKAIKLREQAEVAYRRAATRSRRSGGADAAAK